MEGPSEGPAAAEAARPPGACGAVGEPAAAPWDLAGPDWADALGGVLDEGPLCAGVPVPRCTGLCPYRRSLWWHHTVASHWWTQATLTRLTPGTQPERGHAISPPRILSPPQPHCCLSFPTRPAGPSLDAPALGQQAVPKPHPGTPPGLGSSPPSAPSPQLAGGGSLGRDPKPLSCTQLACGCSPASPRCGLPPRPDSTRLLRRPPGPTHPTTFRSQSFFREPARSARTPNTGQQSHITEVEADVYMQHRSPLTTAQ